MMHFQRRVNVRKTTHQEQAKFILTQNGQKSWKYFNVTSKWSSKHFLRVAAWPILFLLVRAVFRISLLSPWRIGRPKTFARTDHTTSLKKRAAIHHYIWQRVPKTKDEPFASRRDFFVHDALKCKRCSRGKSSRMNGVDYLSLFNFFSSFSGSEKAATCCLLEERKMHPFCDARGGTWRMWNCRRIICALLQWTTQLLLLWQKK